MKPCIRRLLECSEFTSKDEWKAARNLIVKDLRAEGLPPPDITRELVRWGKDACNLSLSQIKWDLVNFVDWLVEKEPIPEPIGCTPAGKMAQMGWCVGDGCEYRQQRRREGNERRAGISPARLAQWKSYLIREERDGFYLVAVYDFIRLTWVERDLGVGDRIYIGMRDIAQAAADAVSRLPARRKRKQDCKRAGRAIHKLEEYHLIRVAERGTPGVRSRRANGYELLPPPESPEGGPCTSH